MQLYRNDTPSPRSFAIAVTLLHPGLYIFSAIGGSRYGPIRPRPPFWQPSYAKSALFGVLSSIRPPLFHKIRHSPLVHRWKSAILDSFTLAHVLKKWPQMVRWILYSLLLVFLSYKACGVVTLLMSIHWSVCWLKKTENKQFDDVLLPISLDFVIVYIKMIIDFKNFLFPFSWRNMVKGTKLITKVWRSIFSTFFGMNAVQNETLKN